MKLLIPKSRCTVLMLALLATLHLASAQDVPGPLTIQGLDQFGYMSARARAMGATIIATGHNATSMFGNPATLNQLKGLDIRFGGYFSHTTFEQKQEWVPNRFYGGLSLMFEDLLDGVQDPTPQPGVTLTRADSVQRPYDDIGPNWQKTKSDGRPSLIAAGMPFEMASIRVSFGLGVSEVVNLNNYYQNNNVLSPNIGLYRPSPIPILYPGESLMVNWYQYIGWREGTIHGFTPAVSFEVVSGLDLGISATILSGSSNDFEQQVDRGRLTFYYDKFRSDRSQYQLTRTGTSSYSGVMTTIGGLFKQGVYGIGVSVQLPFTITREWDRSVVLDSAGAQVTTSESGSDKMKLPLMLMLGASLHPSAKWEVGIDYEVRNYSDAQYLASGTTTNPWLSVQNLKFGVEYQTNDFLALRGGYRTVVQIFAPAGAPLIDEPASGSAYSAGFGMTVGGGHFDVAYEYSHIKYQDMWQSNVNFNTRTMHTVWLETGYSF